MATKSKPMSAPETAAQAAKNSLKFSGPQPETLVREGHDWAWPPGKARRSSVSASSCSADQTRERAPHRRRR
jgi:hypothetical protein